MTLPFSKPFFPFSFAECAGVGGKRNDRAKHPGKAILAGSLAASIEIAITYPTEMSKSLVQLKPDKFSGPLDVVRKTIASHGVLGLYRGLMTLVYTSAPKAAVRFGAFETFKKQLQGQDGSLSRNNTLLCGLGAGITEAVLVVCPAETLKVKFIHDSHSPNPKYKGFFSGVATIIKNEGIASAYKGLLPTIVKQGSNQAIRFFVFAEINKVLLRDSPGRELTVAESMLSGGIAGAASVIGNTPVDVVKTKMQGLDAARYSSSIDCVKQVWRTEGFRGFYSGVTARMARVSMDVAIVMTLYSQITKLLDKVWVTDDH